MWCGLVYAYGLRQLAAIDKNPLWKNVACAITRSAQIQQYQKEGPYQGCYPDSYNLKLNRRFAPAINPEALMVNAWAEEGFDPCIKTKIIKWQGSRIHISSGGLIEKVSVSGSCLRFEVRQMIKPRKDLRTPPFFQAPRRVYVFVGPLRSIRKVLAGNCVLPEVSSLEKVPQGWLKLEVPEGVVIKASTDRTAQVRICLCR